MSNINKQCIDLFNQFIKNEITSEEFYRKIDVLKQTVETQKQELEWDD